MAGEATGKHAAGSQTGQPAFDAGHVPMTEEMDGARWTLPPVLPLVVALLVVGAAVACYLYFGSSGPAYAGQLMRCELYPVHTEYSDRQRLPGEAGSVEKADDVLVLARIRVADIGKQPLFIKSMDATLSTDQGDQTQPSGPTADMDRLFIAYPKLASMRAEPIRAESKLMPGQSSEGLVAFNFPVDADMVNKRKDLAIRITFYDQREPLILHVPAGDKAEMR